MNIMQIRANKLGPEHLGRNITIHQKIEAMKVRINGGRLSNFEWVREDSGYIRSIFVWLQWGESLLKLELDRDDQIFYLDAIEDER